MVFLKAIKVSKRKLFGFESFDERDGVTNLTERNGQLISEAELQMLQNNCSFRT